MKKTYLAAGRGVHAVSACFRCLFLIPIFVLGCFGAHAAAQTQQSVSRVSLDVRDAAIVNVFQTVQQQTGCSFVYNTSDIDTDRKVTSPTRFATSTSSFRRKLKIPPPQRSGRSQRNR